MKGGEGMLIELEKKERQKKKTHTLSCSFSFIVKVFVTTKHWRESRPDNNTLQLGYGK